MKPFLKIFVILSVLFAVTSTAYAEKTADGNMLLEACENSDIWSKGYCTGLVTGASQMAAQFWCSENFITFGQIERIVIKYLQDNPAELHLPAAVLIAMALKKAFPCEK